MSLGVLNNISSIYAENNLNQTQTSLQKTLQQLSSGSRINSGADDAAGLSLADGLQASATALTQSAANASEGVDFLQVGDGALSQVTNLLNRAVTLATEASNGTLNSSQMGAANSEYQKILTEINTINNNTEYNGIASFSTSAFTAGSANNAITGTGGALTIVYNDGTSKSLTAGQLGAITNTATLASGLASVTGANGEAITASDNNGQLIIAGGSVTGTVKETDIANGASGVTTIAVSNASDALQVAGAAGGDELTFSYTKSDGTQGTFNLDYTHSYANLAAFANAINGAATSPEAGQIATVSGNTLVLNDASVATAGAGGLVETAGVSATNNKQVSIFTSDGTISTSYNNTATDTVAASAGALSLTGTALSNSTAAQTALTAIDSAISTVASDRGTIGANINTLTAVENVMNTQSTNTQSAQNDVTATDYAQASSNLSKYEILMQTGISALAQANSTEQLVTKLLQ